MGKSEFVIGAYEFWRKTYARELNSEDAPRAWRGFPGLGSKAYLYRFSFTLETAYLLCARLILAKAIQDHDTGHHINVNHIADRFLSYLAAQTAGRSGHLPPMAYLTATEELFNGYATTLFTSIYAQDLFDWWRDFGLASADTQRMFGLALRRAVLSLLRFDFSALQGDLLGELYQSYFDPETRKALGEFYTPPEVVNFILDEVGFTGESSTRLLDPATGSGTFLIAALRRYLAANAQRDPVEILDGITKEFRLVAFDVNPFAVLMAQINAAALLVPLYARAVQRDPQLVLRRLPIVRTDSLRRETVEGERVARGIKHGKTGVSQEVGFNFDSEEIAAFVELPVRDPENKGEPLRIGVTFPSLEAAKNVGKIANERRWLLALQSVFAAVERVSQAYDRTGGQRLPNLRGLLRSELATYEAEPDALTEYLLPYTGKIWETLQTLKERYGDGRFLKTLEDLTLGLILKHSLQYDFVVGNPPYVRVQNIPEIQRQYWADRYTWVQGNFDIFVPFIERAFYGDRPWLRPHGRVGFIVPNRFLNTNYAKNLRANLPKVAKTLSITDFKAVTFTPPEENQSSRLFREAMVYPAVLVAERVTMGHEPYTFRAARFYPKNAPLHPAEAIRTLRQAYTNGPDHTALTSGQAEYADVFTQPSSALMPDGWYLMPSRERKVFEKLEAVGETLDETLPVKKTDQKRRLRNYTATESGGFAGIQTSLDSHMVLKQVGENVDEGLLYVQPRGGGDRFWVEKDIMRPFLFDKDVTRWYVGWQNWWVIFPYFRHEGRYWFMPSSDYWDFTVKTRDGVRRVFKNWPEISPKIDKTYPRLWSYLTTKDAERAFRGRENRRFDEGKAEEWRWYDLAYPRSLEAFERDKIVLQVTTRRSNLAFDKSHNFFAAGGTSGVYGVITTPQLPVEVLTALANSRAGEFYIKHLSSPFGGGFYSYGDQFIKNLPIPPSTLAQQAEIAALAQTLTGLTAELRRLEAAVRAFPDSVTEALRRDGDVPDLEALSRVGLLQGLPREVSAASLTEAHDLTGQAVFRAGRGQMMFRPTLAELVRGMLRVRGRLSAEALASLQVPDREAEQRRYTATLRKWQNRVGALREQLGHAEAKLNEKVYNVYSMDEQDREVIEGFLERF